MYIVQSPFFNYYTATAAQQGNIKKEFDAKNIQSGMIVSSHVNSVNKKQENSLQ